MARYFYVGGGESENSCRDNIVSILLKDLYKWQEDKDKVSLATMVMISSLLKDSSNGLEAVYVQMILRITNKVLNLFKFKEIRKNYLKEKIPAFKLESSCHD